MELYFEVNEQLQAFFLSALILMMGGVWAFLVGFLRRYQIEWEKRQRRAWKERWRPLLNEYLGRPTKHEEEADPDANRRADRPQITGIRPEDMHLSDREREFLLLEWNEYMGKLDEVHHPAMVEFGEAVDLADKALEMASDSSNVIRRIRGIRALGYLDHPHAWPKAREAVASDQPYLSIAGTQILVELDPDRGLPYLLRTFIDRPDYPPSQALVILKNVPASVVTPHLLDYFWDSEGDERLRLVELFEAGDPGTMRPLIHEQMDDPELSTELLSRYVKALGAFGHPGDEERLIRLTRHDAIPVRIQATKCLGELGTSRSAIPLTEALKDRVWWVRYRAAQSLVGIPDITLDWTKNLLETLDDQYAREILQRVMTEENVA